MNFAQLAFACVLNMVSGGAPDGECDTTYLREIANSVQVESDRFRIPADVIVGVIYHESKFKQDAIGALKEVGLMQVKRGGAASGDFAKMSNWMLSQIRLNVFLGTAYLALARRGCKAFYLTRYNWGHGCESSVYSRGITAELRTARASFRTFLASRKRPQHAPETGTASEENSSLALLLPLEAPRRYWP